MEQNNKLRIYISGKITNGGKESPMVAEEYFNSIEEALTKAGHIAINPMKIAPFNESWTWDMYMVEDMRALFVCDAIFMLDNWTESRGAKIEHAVAKEMGLQIFYSKNHNFF